MELLTVSLLGKLKVQYQQVDITDSYGSKLQEILAYLLIHNKKPLTRNQLCCLFWPDILPIQAKRYLSKNLWQLQSILSSQLADFQEPLVCADTEWIQINSAFPLRLDVDILENAFPIIEVDTDNAFIAAQFDALDEAVSVYQGDLLEGWYHDWCLMERERFRYMILAMLDSLTTFCEQQGVYRKGVHYGRFALQIEPARERTHRQLMRLYYYCGLRTAALRQYDMCAMILRKELDVEPAHSTNVLYELIRRDVLPYPPVEVMNLWSPATHSQPIQHSLQRVYSLLLQAKQQIELAESLLENSLISQA